MLSLLPLKMESQYSADQTEREDGEARGRPRAGGSCPWWVELKTVLVLLVPCISTISPAACPVTCSQEGDSLDTDRQCEDESKVIRRTWIILKEARLIEAMPFRSGSLGNFNEPKCWIITGCRRRQGDRLAERHT